MVNSESIVSALIDGDESKLCELVKNLTEQGISADVILNQGLIRGMEIIGERMENEEIFIPEVLRSARAMAAAVQGLKHHLSGQSFATRGKVVIGTVKGDLHDIGKRLVAMMLESVGIEVFDLGVDVAPEKFINSLKEHNADILALSALLTTTMPMMKKTIDAVVQSGLRNRVKIIVGGAPVNQEFADSIGADGYAPEAGAATRIAKRLLS
jgi:5-methyltetrahydrofolate--homocysteine methyltransferase